MLKPLFDFISSFADLLIPFAVIDEYDRAVVLRLGKRNRVLGPGFHWVLPLGLEEVLSMNVVPKVIRLHPQTLDTSDGKTVTITLVVTMDISDIAKALLEVEDVDDAVVDAITGLASSFISETYYADLVSPEFSEELTEAANNQIAKYGVRILKTQMADAATFANIRLIHSQT